MSIQRIGVTDSWFETVSESPRVVEHAILIGAPYPVIFEGSHKARCQLLGTGWSISCVTHEAARIGNNVFQVDLAGMAITPEEPLEVRFRFEQQSTVFALYSVWFQGDDYTDPPIQYPLMPSH